jgi:hypothetical protein
MISPIVAKIDQMEEEINKLLESEAEPKRYNLKEDVGNLEISAIKEIFEEQGFRVDYSYDGDKDFLEFRK